MCGEGLCVWYTYLRCILLCHVYFLQRSYGITMFEVFTWASVPYGAVANERLCRMLADGFRLASPFDTAQKSTALSADHAHQHFVYETLMLQCWHPEPAHRPTFAGLMTGITDFMATHHLTNSAQVLQEQFLKHGETCGNSLETRGNCLEARENPAIILYRAWFSPTTQVRADEPLHNAGLVKYVNMDTAAYTNVSAHSKFHALSYSPIFLCGIRSSFCCVKQNDWGMGFA